MAVAVAALRRLRIFQSWRHSGGSERFRHGGGGVAAAPNISVMAALAALATTKNCRGNCYAKLNGIIKRINYN